jgi:peroxiredoxin Q/BCP
MIISLLPVAWIFLILLPVFVSHGSDKTPDTGELAPDFELKTPEGLPVKLSMATLKGPVALVMLRGYPGKQSDPCARQVRDLLNKAASFKDAGATVILVYPGAAGKLEEHAREFLTDQHLPLHFQLVVDPDFVLINKYGLRWEAQGETAYPATFVINTKGMVVFAHVSKTRGNRPPSEDVIKALAIK